MPILISNDFPPAHGGIQRMISRLAEEFAARGREVVVVAPKLPGSAHFDAASPYRVIRYAVIRQKAIGLLAMSVTFLRTLAAVHDRMTIASVWWPVGLAVAVVPRRLRGPFAVLAHGSEIAPGRPGLRRWAMRFVYKRADVVIANSRFTQGLLASVGIRAKVRVVALGVDPRDIMPARAAVPTILAVGRLLERKGFDRLVEAVACLAPDFPELRCEILGDGPQGEALRRSAAELGVADRIVFLGSVGDEELWKAYARAWCFALPVRVVGDDVEGFGIVYLEAALAGLPAVGGLHSGAADAIVDGVTGLLVDGNETDAVCKALTTLLREEKLAEEMGRRGRERALQLTWARTADEILNLLPPSNLPAKTATKGPSRRDR